MFGASHILRNMSDTVNVYILAHTRTHSCCLVLSCLAGQTKEFKLPPIDKTDKTRCSLNSSTIGQANAARDKLYDLRECELKGADAAGFDLSGVIMGKTDVSDANFKDAYFSKGYLRGK